MRFLAFNYGANATVQHSFWICLFREFPMQVTTTTPQTLKELLEVGPDMMKVLAIVFQLV
jgi:hypothetical protein